MEHYKLIFGTINYLGIILYFFLKLLSTISVCYAPTNDINVLAEMLTPLINLKFLFVARLKE